MSATPLSTSNALYRASAFFHSASVLSVSSTLGSWRQYRSGQIATKPSRAKLSQVSRMSALMPKISWMTTMAVPRALAASGVAR